LVILKKSGPVKPRLLGMASLSPSWSTVVDYLFVFKVAFLLINVYLILLIRSKVKEDQRQQAAQQQSQSLSPSQSSQALAPQDLPGGRRRVLLVIAHPDDEAMFFVPTLLWLKGKHAVRVLCLSSGNADGLGATRALELLASCKLLGLDESQVTLVDDAALQDGLDVAWDPAAVAEIVGGHVEEHRIDRVITFDEGGVSGHTNHVATYEGVRRMLASMGCGGRAGGEGNGEDGGQKHAVGAAAEAAGGGSGGAGDATLGGEFGGDLSKLTVKALQKELEGRGLEKKGRKAELVERLSEALLASGGEGGGAGGGAGAGGNGDASAGVGSGRAGRAEQAGRVGRAEQAAGRNGSTSLQPRRCVGLKLVSTNIARKYMGPLDAVFSAFATHVFWNWRPGMNYQAMQAHASQFVWYRRLFVVFSRYTFMNTLEVIE
jgi:LmbE family N-acetylglucosaminyl deacetylase